MVAWAVRNMGGLVPKTDSQNLADNMAEQAVNCDLTSGACVGLPIPEKIIDFSTGPYAEAVPHPRRAYRIPDPTGGTADVWLPLPSEFSSARRSPLANDTNHRVYWTNPGDAAPHWATYDMLRAGTLWYDLGIVQPPADASPLTVTVTGGTTDGSVPLVSRSYCFTYVNAFGEESAPCFPATPVDGAPDGVWAIAGLPLSVPPNPVGFNYPPVVGVYLYRTVTGTNTGAQFYRAQHFIYDSAPPTDPYDDTLQDTFVVSKPQLVSAAWANSPVGLDGLTVLPGGMMVGFTGNTVHFCEPDQPHAWPAAYDQSLQYNILGLVIWQQALVAVTEGYPSSGSGLTPAQFTFSQYQVPEPCIARGSIINDLMGVYYESQNGLVMLNYFGMQNQTQAILTKNIWLKEFKAADIIACRHRAQYLAINGTGSGFLIDYSDQRLAIMNLSPFKDVVCVWNDEYTGDAYIIAGTVVYRWDSQNTGPMVYRWRSKQFYLLAPASLGACQISIDPAITTAAAPSSGIPLDDGDPTLELPAGVNAIFRLYAGQNGEYLALTKNLTEPREIFRLPSGFKAFDWQFEIVSRVPIKSVQLASTMGELKTV